MRVEPGDTSSATAELASRLRDAAPSDAPWSVDTLGSGVRVGRGDDWVLVLPVAELTASAAARHAEDVARERGGLLLVGTPEHFDGVDPERLVVAAVGVDAPAPALRMALTGLFERLRLRGQVQNKRQWLERYRYELGELIEIARVMTQERDIDRLLDVILERSRYITGADAGSIYVLERTGDDRSLRFKLSQNDSVHFESSEFSVPVSSRSIAGHAVVTRRPISIDDVYDLPPGAPFGFDASFDRRVGYRTRSMMAVPMISAEDEVIGVIQLINRKRHPEARIGSAEAVAREVVPFDSRSEELLATLATQGGIALENALLYDEIKKLFEGFVHASVQAIEQRDPTTSGHSWRVSLLSCRLAEVVDRASDGPYADARFTRRELKELEYASLLHDFGKIGVREEVLVKAKKLYPHQLTAVRERVYYALKANEADALRRKLGLIDEGAGGSDLARVDAEAEARRQQLLDAWHVIQEANEPTVLSEGDFTKLERYSKLVFFDGEGTERRVVEPEELHSLQVTRGSLNAQEIDEIRSHVVHTRNFLSKIPWGKSFSNIPAIAGAHHEKLDGSGYPHQLTEAEIPLQAKIMTIADIYDALTARDRPYKRAVPVERALAILGFEVEGGKVDGELVRMFRESRIYQAVEGTEGPRLSR